MGGIGSYVTVDLHAAHRGDWDDVCSCGKNTCSWIFCEHATSVIMTLPGVAYINNFIKPFTTLTALRMQPIGDYNEEEQLVTLHPSMNTVIT
eukprot:4674722-Pleurochrysis_carterae.AAC.1